MNLHFPILAAVLFGRQARGTFEGNLEAVVVVVAGQFGNDFNLVAGFLQQLLGVIDANAEEFAPGRASKVVHKYLVKVADRHRSSLGQIRDADWFAVMSHMKPQTAGHAGMAYGQQIAALAGNQPERRDPHGCPGGGSWRMSLSNSLAPS